MLDKVTPEGSGLDPVSARIARDPQFHELVTRRNRASFITVILAMIIYFGYIFLLAFAPGIMSTKVGTTMTVGFPLALGVVIVMIIIVGSFVRQANGTFQRLQDQIVRDAQR